MRFSRQLLLPLFLFLAAAPLHAAPTVAELNRIVAVVDDDVITTSELRSRAQTVVQRISQSGTQLPPRSVLERQILERMILERIQLRLAREIGVRVEDEAVNQVVSNIAAENRLTLAQFREVLARDKVDFGEFRENIRNEITISRLRARQVTNRVVITPQEVSTYLESANESALNNEYRVSHILIALPEAPSPEQVQQARTRAEQLLGQLRIGADFRQVAIANSDGQQALEGGDLGWRKGAQLPSLFTEVVSQMRPGQISDLIRSPSGFHILQLVDKRGEDKRVVRQTQVRHILISTNAITSSAEARARLERLRERIQNGDDFAELARSHSDDRGSASQGGALGWANPGQMVPEFEEVMNKTRIGQLSQPFQTAFGWHILQPLAQRDHDDTEDYQRNRAQEALRQRRIEEDTENWLRQLRDEAYVEYRLEE